jgi:SSS family solute:Na+ symporter
MYTSVLQTPVLLIGSIVIVTIGLIKVGGWGEMMRICSANVTDSGDPMTSLIRSAKDPDFPWTGVLLGSAIIGFWYWCTDQYIVQRVLSGRDQKQSRRGTLFAGYLKLTPVFIFLIPGMIAYALNQKGIITLDSSDEAFPTLVKALLPIGFKGIVVGGLLAALMSSLASLFNSSAMLFTVDFYKKYKPSVSEKELVRVGRIATSVIVICGVLWIPVMKGLGKVLYEYLQDVQSLLAPGIAAVFMLGVFSRKITPAGGLTGLITGFVLGMTRLGLKIFSGSIDQEGVIYRVFLAPNWLHYEIVLFFIVVMVIVFVSLFTQKASEEKLAGLTFFSISDEQKRTTRESWNGWDIFHTIVIMVVVIAFYIYFW